MNKSELKRELYQLDRETEELRTLMCKCPNDDIIQDACLERLYEIKEERESFIEGLTLEEKNLLKLEKY